MTVFSNADPISNQPYLAINGFAISNDPVTPNTLLDVGPGLCRDTTNTFDINLGNWFGEIPSQILGTSLVNGFQNALTSPAANTTTVINAAVNGVNGLDTGTFAAATVYYVHVIFDQTGNNQPACLLSLSRTAPLLPAGYSTWRWIGQATTAAGSAVFLAGYWYGPENERQFFYDAPLATAITAGAAVVATPVNLIHAVPNINNLPVWIYSNYDPAAASDTLRLQPGNGTGYPVEVIGQVAGVHIVTNSYLMSQQVAIATVLSPVVNYIVSSGTDSVAISVAGYYYSL
jgi:hypothetical protein